MYKKYFPLVVCWKYEIISLHPSLEVLDRIIGMRLKIVLDRIIGMRLKITSDPNPSAIEIRPFVRGEYCVPVSFPKLPFTIIVVCFLKDFLQFRS